MPRHKIGATRMPKEFLSRPPDDAKKPPRHSHRYSLLWQFLDACKPGDGEMGDLIRRLRERRDMARSYQHRTALSNYLHNCKIPSAIVAMQGPRLYEMYRTWVEQQKHPHDDTVVTHVDANQLAKSGVTRKQIAIAVLEGFALSDPAEHLNEGGRMADSAFGAADRIIHLITTRRNGQAQKPKSTAELQDEQEAMEGFTMGGAG